MSSQANRQPTTTQLLDLARRDNDAWQWYKQWSRSTGKPAYVYGAAMRIVRKREERLEQWEEENAPL